MAENITPRAHGIVLAGAYSGGQSVLEQLAPRPLLPVAQQPLITYALRWMQKGGLSRATICANSEARAVRAHLNGSAIGMHVDYLEDWTPRGAAGCVRDAGIKTEADLFVVADGTSVPVVDLEELLETHRAAGAALTVVVGADAAGRLRPSGVYVFDRWCFEFIPEDGFQDIKEKLIPRLYGAGEQVSTHMAHAVAPRVVNTDTYLALNQWAVERASRELDPEGGFRASGDVVVHESAVVDESARLLGPVLLGPRVSVHAGATIVGPASIGPGTTVGRGAVVCRSVAWSDCVVGEDAFVDRCMLADGASIDPRDTAFGVLKVNDERGAPSGLRPRRPGRSLWDPIVAALKPATTHQL
jgi:NDP-sugar pyrophosphorylase family protein